MTALHPVADGVLVATSRRDRTNSTVLVSDGRAVLVDPAWEPDELAALAGDLAAAGIEVVAGFSTHAHHDHLLWHPGFGTATRWASAGTVLAATSRRQDLLAELGTDYPDDLLALVGQLTVVPTDRIPWPGPEIRLLVHDAHAPGHTAIWLPDQRVLLAGDMLSDVELPLPEHGGLPEYSNGLDLLRHWADQAALVIPGHGRPGPDAGRRWSADRAYLDALLGEENPWDTRMGEPGMREAHRVNLRLAADHHEQDGSAEGDVAPT